MLPIRAECHSTGRVINGGLIVLVLGVARMMGVRKEGMQLAESNMIIMGIRYMR